ncbi:MAG: DUF4407 domain-containing protein [Cyclobacteriaceae bacterium]|nr:DUF4407 domain-containing protein [Cyclobacteriaceae bacterium]
MEKIKKFFWLCSGASIALLNKCSSESTRYVGIGATVFFTGVFAALAAAYALFTVFDNVWIAAILGLVWGLMIFNLDRFIVSSMRKDGKPWQEWLMASPRIVLAIIISVVIARPLELKIFEKEIQAELVLMEQQAYANQENEVKLRFQSDQNQISSEIEKLNSELAAKTIERNELDKQAREEADGTGGTKQRNAGPIYKLKKADAEKADLELSQLKARNESLLTERRAALAATQSKLQTELTQLQKQKPDGLASRLEALNRIAANSSAIAWASWFILFLFIAIETAPVFVKLISPRGPYDNLLKMEEHGYEVQRVEYVAREHAAAKERLKDVARTEAGYANTSLDILLNKS